MNMSLHSEITCGHKRWRNPKGHSTMDNPETLAMLGTKDAGWRQTEKIKHKTENKRDEHHGPHQISGMNSGTREGLVASV